VAAVDFNGDRYADIVVRNYTNGNGVALYLHGEDPAQNFGNGDDLPPDLWTGLRWPWPTSITTENPTSSGAIHRPVRTRSG
jgi:hypothetical protein